MRASASASCPEYKLYLLPLGDTVRPDNALPVEPRALLQTSSHFFKLLYTGQKETLKSKVCTGHFSAIM